MNFSPQIITKIEQIMANEIKIIALLAEVVEEIEDPALRAVVSSLIGEENGHLKFLALLLSLADGEEQKKTKAVCQPGLEKQSVHSQTAGATKHPSANKPAPNNPVPTAHISAHKTKVPVVSEKAINSHQPDNKPVDNLEVVVKKKSKKLVWTFGS